MAKEKVTTTSSCTFSSFEDLISILFWAEASLNDFVIFKVLLESLHKQFSLMKGYFNIAVRGYLRDICFGDILTIHFDI